MVRQAVLIVLAVCFLPTAALKAEVLFNQRLEEYHVGNSLSGVEQDGLVAATFLPFAEANVRSSSGVANFDKTWVGRSSVEVQEADFRAVFANWVGESFKHGIFCRYLTRCETPWQ